MTFPSNAHVNEALVSAHCDWIFANTQADVAEMARIAELLERAQVSLELDGAIGRERAAAWIESAARQVFGQGSTEYANMADFYAVDTFRPLCMF